MDIWKRKICRVVKGNLVRVWWTCIGMLFATYSVEFWNLGSDSPPPPPPNLLVFVVDKEYSQQADT